MRKVLIFSAICLAFTGAAACESPTSLQYVTTKGVIMKVSGMELPVVYTADGKFTAMNGAITGTWRIDGDKMCSKSVVEPEETCIVYPAGKKPGDEFELSAPKGPFTIKINQ